LKKDLTERICTNESYFNHGLLWSLLEFAVDLSKTKNLAFIPGEHILCSSQEEYKADAAVKERNGLETSGKILLKDIPRFSYDHVKGCFGVLTC
jgi:hypothetical protein